MPQQENMLTLQANEKLKLARILASKQYLDFPERFKISSFENFIGREGKVLESKQAIMSKTGVFLTGSCGSGKTHLAYALARFWYENSVKLTQSEYSGDLQVEMPKKPQIWLSLDILASVRGTFSDQSSDSENLILEKLSSVPFLVIDDLGSEKVSDWSRAIIYALVDKRYRNMKLTCFTSNFSLEQIKSLYGDDRMVSRICEMCKIINLGNEDFRLKNLT